MDNLECNYILYNLWTGGLSNQLIALETACFLNLLLQKDICIPIKDGLEHNLHTFDPKHASSANCFSLFDIPFDYQYKIITEDYYNNLPTLFEEKTDDSLASHILFFGTVKNKIKFQEFSENKIPLCIDSYINDQVIYKTPPGGYLHIYETLFYLESDLLKKELISRIKSLRLSSIYDEVKYKIIDFLSPFNGLHIRLSDHDGVFGKLTSSMVIDKMKKIYNNDYPIIISTCSPDSIFFDDIKEEFKNAILIDDIFELFNQDFKQLPFGESEILKAALSQEILAESKIFAGKFYSTFTGRINKLRYFKDPNIKIHFINDEVYMDSDEKYSPVIVYPEKKYSWNQYNLHVFHPNTLAWCARWKECLLES